jgi:hypothetical protein
MVKEKRPMMVFLMKTKLSNNNRFDSIKNRIGYDGLFVVDSVGRSGGLALFWKNEFNVIIQNYSRRHINAVIKIPDSGLEWKFTGFYKHLETVKRKEAWSLLRHLRTFSPMPWLCVGDFNEVLTDSEKFRGARKPWGQMADFRSKLEHYSLSDLGFSGPKFTWCNYQNGHQFTKERLDRATTNHEWCDIFPFFQVGILVARSSNRTPLYVSFATNEVNVPKKKQLFRYEACWERKKEFKEVIKKAWWVKSIREDVWGKVKEKNTKMPVGVITMEWGAHKSDGEAYKK